MSNKGNNRKKKKKVKRQGKYEININIQPNNQGKQGVRSHQPSPIPSGDDLHQETMKDTVLHDVLSARKLSNGTRQVHAKPLNFHINVAALPVVLHRGITTSYGISLL